MEKIIWNEKFSVGVGHLDYQHKQIIDMINKLIHSNEIKAVDSEELSCVLTDMIRYSEYHFKNEEQYLLKFNYPGYQKQKEDHIEFIEKTVNFCNGATVHKLSTPQEVISYLRSWWINHILESDMLYKKFFEEKVV